VKFVFMSDSHEQHRRLKTPDGDVFVHCGDFSDLGEPEAVDDFCRWLEALPHSHRFVVPGNHDLTFDPRMNPDGHRAVWAQLESTGAVLLIDREVTLPSGVRLYGSPWTVEFGGWAFMEPDQELSARWKPIPSGLDVLVTHGPPLGVLDRNHWNQPCGSESLARRVTQAKPRHHVFGHIHEAFGHKKVGETTFHNVACHAVSIDV
jgi:Icc-related predicted phosphoesterase